MGWAASSQGLPPGRRSIRAEAACGRAVRSSSKDGRALVQRALVLLARLHVLGSEVSADTIPMAENALAAAEQGVKARPGDVMAHYAVALALQLRTQLLYELGREASMAPVIAAYERVLSLDRGFTWAVNELGDAYLAEAKKEIAGGGEGARWVDSAIGQYEKAMDLDSRFLLPAGGRLDALTVRLEADLDRGRDPEGALQALAGAVSRLEKTSSSPWLVAFWTARLHRLRASRDLAFGGDPGGSLRIAVETIRAFAGEAPKDYWFLEELALCRLLEAEHAAREGLDPEPALAKARDAVRKAGELRASMNPSLRLLSARIGIATLRAAAKRKEAREEGFEAAFADVRPLLSEPGIDSVPYQLAAALHAERAEWRAVSGRSPEEDLRGGLALVEQALSKNPCNAEVLREGECCSSPGHTARRARRGSAPKPNAAPRRRSRPPSTRTRCWPGSTRARCMQAESSVSSGMRGFEVVMNVSCVLLLLMGTVTGCPHRLGGRVDDNFTGGPPGRRGDGAPPAQRRERHAPLLLLGRRRSASPQDARRSCARPGRWRLDGHRSQPGSGGVPQCPALRCRMRSHHRSIRTRSVTDRSAPAGGGSPRRGSMAR